jgi:hypothetical protein
MLRVFPSSAASAGAASDVAVEAAATSSEEELEASDLLDDAALLDAVVLPQAAIGTTIAPITAMLSNMDIRFFISFFPPY